MKKKRQQQKSMSRSMHAKSVKSMPLSNTFHADQKSQRKNAQNAHISAQSTQKSAILPVLFGIFLILALFIFLQSRYHILGKATAASSDCIAYWESYCYETECTAQDTAQCHAYCTEKTTNRCIKGDMPIPIS